MKTDSLPTVDSEAAGSTGTRSDHTFTVHHNSELSQHLAGMAREYLVAQLQGGQNPPPPAGYWIQPSQNQHSDYHLPPGEKVVHVSLSSGETTFHLPANTTFDTIRIIGHDLVLVQKDGTAIVLDDAGDRIPNIVVGDVDIPKVALEAAFTANGIQAAEGPSGSSTPASGGDFVGSEPGGIGNAYGLTGLLGPEGFNFTPTNVTVPPPPLPQIVVNSNPEPLLTVSESNLTAGTNGGVPGSDPDLALTSVSANFSVDFTATPDINGGRVTYSLSIPGNGTASGLVDSQTGEPDVLVQNGNTIEGHVGSAGGALAFTISVNPNTGVVTFTEDRAVIQAQTSNSNPSENVVSISAGVVTLTATITDGLGHQAAASIDLGKQISITDDGPHDVANAATVPGLTLSESDLTAGTNGVDGTTPHLNLTTITGHFSGDFTDTSGADGLKSTTYALSINGGNGAASGFVDSQTGQADVLVQNGNVIEGHVGSAGGALAFTITLDPSNGDVTFVEDRAIENNGTGSTGLSLTAGLVTLTQTIVDNDGTSASASIDLGAKLSITDDTPVVTLSGAKESSVIVHEADLQASTNGVDGTVHDGLTSATGDFSTAFTDNFGADGQAKTGAISYALTVGNGGVSGFVDTQTGQADVLVQTNATTITGYVGSQASGIVAFTISVNAQGVVTFTEDRSVENNGTGSSGLAFATGSVMLSQTITDGDGSTGTNSIDISQKLAITDDTPQISTDPSAVASLTLSESHLTFWTNGVNGTDPDWKLTQTTGNFSNAFSDTPGADGLKSTSYALSIVGGNGKDSGLVDSQTGLHDILFQSGNTITGFVGHTGIVAFTITLDPSTGKVTFTEDRSVENNGTGSTGISLAAGVVELTQTITDGDGSTASASIDLGAKLAITDDGPKISTVAWLEPDLVVSESHLTAGTNGGISGSDPNSFLTHTSGDFSFAFADNPGADGLKSISYALTVGNGGVSGLVDTQTGLADVLVQVNATTIEGHVGNANGALAFTITVDAFGIVTFTEDRAVVQSQDGHDPSHDLASFAAGALTLTQTLTDNDGTTTSASLDISGQLAIADDGPHIDTHTSKEPTVTVSEADLQASTNGVDGTVHNGATTATGNFSGNFSDTFGADGAAKTGAVSYTLSVSNLHHGVGQSGLVDTQTGLNDVLVQVNATTIEGHVGNANGALAFTISVDPTTGIVSFTEDRSVEQSQDGNDPSNRVATLEDGAVSLTQTITDGDGTTTSASLDIGDQLQIKDDGPQITVTAANAPVLTLSESNLTSTSDDNHTPGTNPNLNATTTTQSFAAAFTDVFGADGQAKSDAVSYALTLNGATHNHPYVDSGLVDTLSGTEIYLHQSGNTITGYVGQSTNDPIAFTITLGSNGNVTFTEDRSVENNNTGSAGASINAGLVTLTQTITDGDGTSTSGQLDIGRQLAITDDTPKVTLSGAKEPSVIVHEADLQASTNGINGTLHDGLTSATGDFSTAFTDNFGADGQAKTGATSYALTVGNGGVSGFIDTQTGHADVLVQTSATTITGYVGSQASGIVAFTINVNAQGVVTFTEDRSVENNGTGSTGLAFAAGALTLTQTITDGDGSTGSKSIDIGQQLAITDDAPIIAPIPPVFIADVANSSVSGTWAPTFGADGENHTAPVSLAIGTAPAGETYTVTDTQTTIGGHEVFEVQVGGAASYTFYEYTVQGTAGAEMFAFSDEAGQNPFFTLDVLANGTYTFDLESTSLPGGNKTITFSSGGEHDFFYSANGNTSLTAGDYNFIPPNFGVPSNYDVLITAPGFHEVGISNGKMGVDGNQLNTYETLDFNFGAPQTAVTIGVAAGDNAPNEEFQITIWNSNHTHSSTEIITLADGTALDIDKADWQGNAGGWFQSGISEVDVTNLGTGTGKFDNNADDQLSLTSISEGGTQSTSVPPSQLDFNVGATDGDGSNTTTNLAVNLVAPPQAVAGPYAESVSESGLPQGSHPNPSAIVDTVQVSFTAGSDNANVTLNDSALTTTLPGFQGLTWQVVNGVVEGFQGNTEVVSFAITGGSTIQAGQTGTVTITEALLAPIDGDNNGGAGDLGTLNVVAADVNNSSISATDQVSVGVIDDKPIANPDTLSDSSGRTVSGDAAHGLFSVSNTGGADKMGADGPATGNVVGVTSNNDNNVGTAGTAGSDGTPYTVQGEYGTLTLNQDGSYSYQANPDTTGLTGTKIDTFTYTLKDGDGSTSTSTLTVNVNEVHPTASPVTATVYEAGLVPGPGVTVTGSGQGPTTTLVQGQLALSDPNGDAVHVQSITVTIGGVVYNLDVPPGAPNVPPGEPGSGGGFAVGLPHGIFTIYQDGTYSYQLKTPESASPYGSGQEAPDTVTVTIADSDGNTSNTTFTFNIVDDKPLITVGALPAAESVSESNLPSNAGDNNTPGTSPGASDPSVTQHFGPVFTDNFGADGPATTGATTYALSIGTNGAATGLTDTLTGTAVTLVQNGTNEIDGKDAHGDIVFTLTVNASGDVTFTLDRSVENNGGPATLPANAVTLTQTLTDGDGSTTSAPLDISKEFSIADDKPQVSLTNTPPTAQSVSESHLPTGTSPGTHSVQENYAGAFSDKFGADGQAGHNTLTSGDAPVAYALSIGNNGLATATGLTDTLSGKSVSLVQVSTTEIDGKDANGDVVFKITVDQTGEVTFELDRPVENSSGPVTLLAGSVLLTQTITDGDGSTASNKIDISQQVSITDDKPVVTLSGAAESSVIVHEADLQASTNGVNGTLHDGLTSATGDFSTAFTDNFGADGQAKTGATSYALTVGNGGVSGFIDTQTGHADVLVQTSATTITGYVGSQASGIVAFTISVNAQGVVTFTEDRSVENNGTGSSGLAFATGSVMLSQTITDGDGSTTTSPALDISQKLAITDDTPVISSIANAPASDFHNGVATESWQPVFGADGEGSTPVTLAPNPTTLTDTHTQVTISSHSYELYKVVDGSTTYYEATVPTSTGSTIYAFSDAQGQDPFFQLQVSASGSYTFTQDSATSASAGGNINFDSAGSPGTYMYLASNGTLTSGSSLPSPTPAFYMQGFDNGFAANGYTPIGQGTLKPSAQGLGVDNNNLGFGETVAFHFGSAQSDIQIGIAKGNGNMAPYEEFQVTIYNGTQHATETITQADGAPIKIDAADWQGTLPSWFSSGVTEVDVTNLGTGTNSADKNVTLTSIDYATAPTSNSGGTLNFEASITDGDGSTSATKDFSVTTPGGTAPTIIGSGSDLAYEAGLPGGSNSALPSTVSTASVAVTAGSNPNFNVTLAAGGLTQTAGITWITSANGQEIDGYQTQNGTSVEVLSLALVAGAAGTYTIQETIDHALANNGASTGGDLGNLYVVATDASDPALTSFTPVAVGVVDDTPQIAGIQDAIVNNAAGSTATGTIATLISGADGFASTPVTVALTSGPTTFNGQALHYWGGAGTSSPNEIIAYTGTVDGSATNAPSSNKQVFTFTVDETAPGGHYVFNLLQPLTLPATTQDVSYFYTANGGFNGALYSAQNVEIATVVSNDGFPLNHVGTGTDGGVGINHALGGPADYYFAYGDQMTFSIQGNQADAAFTFNAVNTAHSATVDYTVTYADGSSTSGSIDPDNYTNSAWTTPQAGDGSTIESVSFSDVGGGTSWTISLDSVTSEPSNQNLSFNVTTTDGDGSTATAMADIAVDNVTSYSVNYNSNPGSLNGTYHEITEPAGTTGGGHLLAGDSGNDIFIPTFSGETLQAGSGHDIFVIPTNANEIITDFNSSNDTIDLTQLLSNVTASASVVGGTNSNYVEYNTSTGVLSVDTTGTGNHFQQVATLTQTNGSPATAPNIVYQDSSHQAHLVAVHHNG